MGEYMVWVIVAGVIGLALGFGIAYLVLGRNALAHRDELTSLRSSVDERQARIEEAETRMRSLNKRVEEKEHQLEAAKNEIEELERTLEEKASKEKKAIQALRDAFHEDVRSEQVRSTEAQASDEAQRRAQLAEERRRAEVQNAEARAEEQRQEIEDRNRR